jgi:transcription antitermination factor NusG
MTGYWIGYAQARQEFAAKSEISAAGITCHVPKKVEMVRQGNRRWPDPVTMPALQNYVFFCGSDQDWHKVRRLNVLRATMIHIGQRAWQSIVDFTEKTEADYTARMNQIFAGQRVAQYKPDETLEIIAGPLAGQLATFRRMIESTGQWPEIEASVNIMGADIKTRLDPLHARPIANKTA